MSVNLELLWSCKYHWLVGDCWVVLVVLGYLMNTSLVRVGTVVLAVSCFYYSSEPWQPLRESQLNRLQTSFPAEYFTLQRRIFQMITPD